MMNWICRFEQTDGSISSFMSIDLSWRTGYRTRWIFGRRQIENRTHGSRALDDRSVTSDERLVTNGVAFLLCLCTSCLFDKVQPWSISITLYLSLHTFFWSREQWASPFWCECITMIWQSGRRERKDKTRVQLTFTWPIGQNGKRRWKAQTCFIDQGIDTSGCHKNLHNDEFEGCSFF